MTHNAIGSIYATYDYDWFKNIPENRGHAKTNGLKQSKLNKIQELINDDQYCEEYGIIMVNKNGVIVNGHHNFEVRRRNGMPIRYIIIEDARYNSVTKKDLLNNVLLVNKINTAWSGPDLFRAAYQQNRRLALDMFKIIDDNDNRFRWYDLMGLLTKNVEHFIGRIEKVDLKTFDDEALISQMKSKEFLTELDYFIKINDKARVAFRKSILLASVYGVLWKSKDIVNEAKFRQSALNIPDDILRSKQATKTTTLIPIIIKNYNRKYHEAIRPSAVVFQVCKIQPHTNGLQEVVI